MLAILFAFYVENMYIHQNDNMKVLVTGADGQLGRCLRDIAESEGEMTFFFYGKSKLDITNEESVRAIISEVKPNIIINCAAFVNTVAADTDMKNAYLVNTEGPEILATVCKENDIDLIHVSTDFVFDGENNTPYQEYDECHPLNVYGMTKYFGEIAIQRVLPSAIIIRTSWLYSEYGNNFVKKVISTLGDNENHMFVDDQISCPTYAGNLARFIYNICIEMSKKESDKIQRARGIYHFTDRGIASRYDFARAIEEYYYGDEHDNVKACSIKSFKDSIKRPIFSVLGKERIGFIFHDYDFEDWRRALKRCIEKIKEKQD